MKVFLSHSGDRSKALALELQKLVRKLVPAADPWISTGIEKGSRWVPEIAENLEAAGVGIVCVASDNLTAPWLMYEAGALSKRLNGKVCTFLLDVDPATVQAPLSQFQHTIAEKTDVLALVEGINARVAESGELQRNLEDLREQFETLWPKLADTIKTLRAQAPARPPNRTADDMIKEVLEIVRGLARTTAGNLDEILETERDRAAQFARNAIRKLREAMSDFSIGDAVEHPLFGKGKILEMMPIEGGDHRVKVDFEQAGQKVLRLDYARLKKLR